MAKRWLGIVFLGFLIAAQVGADNKVCTHKPSEGGSTKFPDNFIFGVSTAAYQIEGAWNEDGKGPSIWDTFTHNFPDLIADKSNGDVGPDSYHKFDKDLEALKELGVQYYRFSISWPRIMPNGDVSSLNQKGIDYYNMVINKLLANNIQPMVTMFHNDLPEQLSRIGGFSNPVFIDYFEAYADTLFRNFGDRVKVWVTFNEPFIYCNFGYGHGIYPPQVHKPGIGDYICMDVSLKAHAVVYHRYKRIYSKQQKGKIGISLNTGFQFSRTNETDVVDRAMQYSLGWLAYPIFGDKGQYPAVMLNDVAMNSANEGRPWSRLQPLDSDWSNLVKHSADFLGLNYYASSYAHTANPPPGENPSWDYDTSLGYEVDESWKRAKSTWLYCVPEGLEGLLKWIRDNYNNVEVIITENGWSDDGELADQGRIDYMKAHLQATLNAINDGCNVGGFIQWSLLDNFEWLMGYTEKFGLYQVDIHSDEKNRVPKDSARYYKEVVRIRQIPDIN